MEWLDLDRPLYARGRNQTKLFGALSQRRDAPQPEGFNVFTTDLGEKMDLGKIYDYSICPICPGFEVLRSYRSSRA
jgi:hypothetical protein